LHILRGDGAGRFATKSSYTLPNAPREVVTGDFNGDGRHDLLVMTTLAGEALGFVGSGNGEFVTWTQPLSLGGSFFYWQLADFTGDGRTDLAAVVNQPGGSALTVFHAQTNGLFGLQQTLSLPGVGGLSLGDLNKDGRPDLLVTGTSARVLHGNASGTFEPPVALTGVTVVGPVSVVDVSGDGYADLVVGGQVQRADGQGGFLEVETYSLGNAELPQQVADVNGDQLPDIISAGDFTDSVFILLHK
jgi:hypothetical protein